MAQEQLQDEQNVAHRSAPGRIWPKLPMELADIIVSFLPPNVVACCIRPLNKAAAARYCEPQHKLVQLRQPVPAEAIVKRWDKPDAMRCLTEKQRRALLRLSATNGSSVIPLQVTIARCGLVLDTDLYEAAAAGGNIEACTLLWQQPWPHGAKAERDRDAGAMRAAARAGKINVCRWLHEEHRVDWNPEALHLAARCGDVGSVLALHHANCPWDQGTANAAAAGGHQQLLQSLIANGCPLNVYAATVAAARNGHQGLVLALIARPEYTKTLGYVAEAVALGCDLPILQAVLGQRACRGPHAAAGDTAIRFQESVCLGAMRSHTHDWQAKLRWLVQQCRYRPSQELPYCDETQLRVYAATPEAAVGLLRRHEWLRQQGYMKSGAGRWHEERLVGLAAGQGNIPVLQRLLAEGVAPSLHAALAAAQGGHIAALQLLHAQGCSAAPTALVAQYALRDRSVCVRAAGLGQVALMQWLLEALGAAGVLVPDVMAAAACSGSVELVAWLRARRCPWDENTFAEAARGGSEEMLEWLAEAGCPMGVDGRPYMNAARNCDVATMCCLSRLGCRWDAATYFASLVACPKIPPPMLPVLCRMAYGGILMRVG